MEEKNLKEIKEKIDAKIKALSLLLKRANKGKSFPRMECDRVNLYFHLALSNKCKTKNENRVSNTENILYSAMIRSGLKPKRQYTFSGIKKYHYCLDFAFPNEKVNVEVDGTGGYPNHHLTENRRRKDNTRDDVMQSLGWRVRRFTDKEVRESPFGVAMKIKRFLNNTPNNSKEILPPRKEIVFKEPPKLKTDIFMT